MAESDLEELTDVRTLIDIRSVSPYSQSEEEETRIPSPYKSYTFSETSKDSVVDSSDFPASPLRPDSRSARFEKIYYVSETDDEREYAQESFEAASVSERSSLASQTESELGYSDESWEEAASSTESDDEKAEIARALQEEFIEKKLQHLRKLSSQQHIPHRAEPVFLKKTKTKLPPAAKQFCKKKLQVLRSPQIKPANRGQEVKKTQEDDGGTDKQIDRRLIERLRLTNILEKMQKAARVELHNPHKCRICCCARESNTEQSFVKMKTAIAQNKNMDLKVERYLNTHDSITLIGDLAKTLPKPTEDPQEIWRKMMLGIS